MESTHARATPLGRTEIDWDKLDKTKFYVTGAGLFTGITVALYPVSLVKTRMQVASREIMETNASSIVKNILRTDGITGLYRGFGTVMTGAIPARIIFLTNLETAKVSSYRLIEPFNFSEPVKAAIANGMAGLSASTVSQAFFVPLDVVSQKLMVQGYSGNAKYSGGFDAACQIVRSSGIRGLYRGFGLSIMTYSPSSAVWWASYGSSQRIIWKLLEGEKNGNGVVHSQWTMPAVQATGGLFAGAVSSCITTPLDTIKTRLQVMESRKGVSVRSVTKSLVAEEGWRGLYRGLGPRFVSMSAWGTSMILAYEYLKRLCFDGGEDVVQHL